MPNVKKNTKYTKTNYPIVVVMADGYADLGRPFNALSTEAGYLYDDRGGMLYSSKIHSYKRGPLGGAQYLCGRRRGQFHRKIQAVLNPLLLSKFCSDCLKLSFGS